MEKQPLKISARSEKPEGAQKYWSVMTFYERFEQIVLMILSFIISLVVVFALLQLLINIWSILRADIFNPMDYEFFQVIFGMIMTLLIAMEFKHSIIKVLERRSHIIQVKAIILLALLALSRKFIIIDLETVKAFKLIALSLSVLVLGTVYWLLDKKDEANESLNQCDI